MLCDGRRRSRLTWPAVFVTVVFYIWYRIYTGYSAAQSPADSIVQSKSSMPYQMIPLDDAPVVHVSDDVTVTRTNSRCTHFTCFDVYKCDTLTSDRIKVYVYPIRRYVDSAGTLINDRMSREMREVLSAVTGSEYHTSDPRHACLFLPSLDLLSQSYVKLEESSRILSSLTHWNDSRRGLNDRPGSNHLIFGMIPGSYPSYNRRLDLDLADALIAGGGFDSWSFRSGFDVAIPVYSPYSRDWTPQHRHMDHKEQRKYLLSSSQYEYVGEEKKKMLLALQHEHAGRILLISDRCESNDVLQVTDYKSHRRCTNAGDAVQYPDMLTKSSFCLILRTAYLSTPLLAEALMTACIPVFVADDVVLPFEEKIDWRRAGIRIREDLLPDVVSMLSHVSAQRIAKMRSYASHVYEKYFKSMKVITLTTLEILNDRLIPSAIRRKDDDHRCHSSGNNNSEL